MIKAAYAILLGILLVMIWQDGRAVGRREGIQKGFEAGVFSTTTPAPPMCIDNAGMPWAKLKPEWKAK